MTDAAPLPITAAIAAPATPSWQTGEFYTALAPLLAGLIGHSIAPGDVSGLLTEIGAVVTGGYAIARTVLKMVHTHTAGQLAQTQLATQIRREAAAVSTVLSDADLDRVADAVTARFTATGRLKKTPKG